MGIKDFFKKAWDKVKTGARATYNWVRDKAMPTIGKIAKVGGNILSNMPGWLGKAGKVISGAVDIGHQIAGQIPNEGIRKKIDGGLDKIGNGVRIGVDTGQKINRRVQDAVNDATQRVGAVYDAVKAGVGKMKQDM